MNCENYNCVDGEFYDSVEPLWQYMYTSVYKIFFSGGSEKPNVQLWCPSCKYVTFDPLPFFREGGQIKKKIGRATLLQYDDYDSHLPKFWESQPQFLYFYKKTLGRTNMDINNWNTINLWEKSCRYFHSSGNQTECMIMIS